MWEENLSEGKGKKMHSFILYINYLYRRKEYKNGIWAARQFYNI